MHQVIEGVRIETVTTGPFAENCFIVTNEGDTPHGVVIDPGDEAPRILDHINQLEARIEAIICTHAHIDHVGAAAEVREALQVPLLLHPAERQLLQALPLQAGAFGLPVPPAPTVDADLADGQSLTFGELHFEVLLTPGHSPGGCSLLLRRSAVLFAGDTLFAGSIGRTDLPGGNGQLLLDSIKQRLLPLADEIVVFCGHGPSTTIGAERKTNPFLAGL